MAILSCDQFRQLLVDEQPYYDKMIMEDIRPVDGWLLNVDGGTMPVGTPVEVTQDRFKTVYPNVTKVWTRANAAGCIGTPCDQTEHCIGMGAERITFYAEKQSWATPLFCYRQSMHVTHAKEHLAFIITETLKDATVSISSSFLRKRTLQWSGKKWVANATQSNFTFEWTLGGAGLDEEIFFDCSVAPASVFLLAPQMLQRRFSPLMRQGYAGKNPFKETLPFIELVTDMDTLWSLDKLAFQGGGSSPSVGSNWRFTQWDAANEFWRYGFSGRIGNYLARVDEWGLRFNYVGQVGAGAVNPANVHRYQVVLPYKNVITTGAGGDPGLGSEPNADFETALYGLSFISHKKGLQLLTMADGQLNENMPFGPSNFGGKWRWVQDNLGVDVNGCVIENKRREKGQFIADFEYYIRPMQTKYLESIFHERGGMCVTPQHSCNPDPGYPTQTYDSCNEACPTIT